MKAACALAVGGGNASERAGFRNAQHLMQAWPTSLT